MSVSPILPKSGIDSVVNRQRPIVARFMLPFTHPTVLALVVIASNDFTASLLPSTAIVTFREGFVTLFCVGVQFGGFEGRRP